jgi:hypothetical protein
MVPEIVLPVRVVRAVAAMIGLVAVVAGVVPAAAAPPPEWRIEWPRTDFTKAAVPFREIFSGGPPKDGIPSIDRPAFVPVAAVRGLADTEPVVGFVLNGDARAYPLRILTWHEIVNDTVGGVPVAVTYCPLCNSSIVFDRRLDDRVLDFGTTGKLRHSDLVMYDRQTESWWQQFLGQAIVGTLTGRTLAMLPSRLESFAEFKARAPEGRVLVPNNPGLRAYGRNPYVGYDSARQPFLYRGELPKGVEPMMRVVAVGKQAWTWTLLRAKGTIEADDLRIRWRPGQNSALDADSIAQGRDVGGVVVQRLKDGKVEDVVHDVTFAFVFHAFHPDGAIHDR